MAKLRVPPDILHPFVAGEHLKDTLSVITFESDKEKYSTLFGPEQYFTFTHTLSIMQEKTNEKAETDK